MPLTSPETGCGTLLPRRCGTPCPSGDSAPFQALSPIPEKGRLDVPFWTSVPILDPDAGSDRFPFVRGLAEGFAACIPIRRKPYDFRS